VTAQDRRKNVGRGRVLENLSAGHRCQPRQMRLQHDLVPDTVLCGLDGGEARDEAGEFPGGPSWGTMENDASRLR
jgi:hypothetical protein